jgi:hypothetical protein
MVVGLIPDDDETAYREEVRDCQDNNLSLKVSKTKELIVDYRKQGQAGTHSHQWGCSGVGRELQAPQCPHHSGINMVHTHQHSGEECMTTPLPPLEAETFGMDPQNALQLHH